MGGFIERIKSWWNGSTPTQRYVTLGGIAITVMLFIGIFSVASRPRYAMLYGGLTQEAQAAIVTEIQAQGVAVRYDTPGVVEVPADKVADLRMKLTSSGKVPKNAHMGEANLGEMNLYTTPAVERERLKAIAEGELAQSIETNPGVRSARVHITLGDPSPFAEQQRPPTASVSLITAGSGAINRDSARGIALLVANSVDGLDLKHVVVLDEKAQTLFDGASSEGVDAAANNKIEMEQTLARKEEQRIQANLDSIFGPGNTKVSVRCEVDLDEVRANTKKRQIEKGAAVKKMTETMRGEKGAGGPAGAGSNVGMQPADRENSGESDYNSSVEQMEPTITETEEVRNKSMGSVKSMVINVAANTATVRANADEDLATKKEEFTAKVKELVEAELANKTAGQDAANFKAIVTGVDFDATAKTEIKTSQDKAMSEARMQQMLSMLPIAALLIVGMMVVKQLGKMSKDRAVGQIVTASGQVIEVPLVNGEIPTNYAMVAAHQPTVDLAELIQQEAANEDTRLAPRYTEEELARMSEDGIIYRGDDDIMEVEKIKERKSAHLAAIKQMAKDRPEPTAMLIKTWLSEDEKVAAK